MENKEKVIKRTLQNFPVEKLFKIRKMSDKEFASYISNCADECWVNEGCSKRGKDCFLYKEIGGCDRERIYEWLTKPEEPSEEIQTNEPILCHHTLCDDLPSETIAFKMPEIGIVYTFFVDHYGGKGYVAATKVWDRKSMYLGIVEKWEGKDMTEEDCRQWCINRIPREVEGRWKE